MPRFASVSDVVTQEMINAYAELSGDYNPLHVDEEVAARSEFGGTIAHGPLSLQVIFRSVAEALGSDAFPPGTRVSVAYRAPVRAGDEVASWFADPVIDEHGMTVEAECRNQSGEIVVSSTLVLPLP